MIIFDFYDWNLFIRKILTLQTAIIIGFCSFFLDSLSSTFGLGRLKNELVVGKYSRTQSIILWLTKMSCLLFVIFVAIENMQTQGTSSYI